MFKGADLDERIAIWNVFHDGEITAASYSGSVATLFVSIGYLRRRLMPTGGGFVLKLSGVTDLRCHDFDGKPETLDQQLEAGRLQVHGTDSELMPVIVDTTMGKLTLCFETLDLALDTGQPVTFAEIASACEAYWHEWERKGRQSDAS